MAGVYVYSDSAELNGELISLARTSRQEVCAITMNDADAAEIVKYGPDTVFILKGKNGMAESYAGPMGKLLADQNASAFLVGATVRGRDIAARVAAKSRCGLVSESGKIVFENGAIYTSRYMYGGLAEQTEACRPLTVFTVSSGKYPAVKNETMKSVVISMTVDTDPRIKLLESLPIVRQGADLAKAKRIVCIGMGFDKKEDIEIADTLASAIGAEMGCTRCIAEDRGWMPAQSYIGISGTVVKPDLYLALGVSGQIQHTFGVRDAKVIVGINNNEKAPIFSVADYGIVGDLYEIAPLIAEAAKTIKD